MISTIGSKPRRRSKGFTLIEILVALVVLSVGLVSVFRTFIASLNHLSHLTNRLYADNTLDNQFQILERKLRAYKALPVEIDEKHSINMGHKEFQVSQQMVLAAVEDFPDLFHLTLIFNWDEHGKEIKISRSGYISEF